MVDQRSIRYGILGVVVILVAALGWLGFARYQEEQRTLRTVLAGPSAPPAEAAPAAAQVPAPAATPTEPEFIVVHVAGAVVSPGVYRLEKRARVADAIAAAGGKLPDAVPDALNLADRLEDGMKVQVPTKKELESAPPAPSVVTKAPAASAAPAAPSKVNINTATAAQLDGLPGVTPTAAQNIVDYRAKHGPFKKIEDLDKVSGIGPATIDKIRDRVTL